MKNYRGIYLCTMLSSSSCDKLLLLNSIMSDQSQVDIHTTDIWHNLPGRALFFLDMGADLVKHGDGDRSKICPRLFAVAESMCIGAGEDMRRVECSMELQVRHSKLQMGE